MTLASMYEFVTGVVEYQPWRERAACRGLGPGLFFPERGEGQRQAKAVCAGCPVKQECYDYSQATPERFGLWGQKSERERRMLRRRELEVVA